jgi:hypothetical protein
LSRGAALALVFSTVSVGASAAQDLTANRGTGTPADPGCITRDHVGEIAYQEGSGIELAFFWGPTERYPHGVLGDKIEATSLLVRPEGFGFCDSVQALNGGVFEDVLPRIADLNGDGRAEVTVVSSHPELGARLDVWGYPNGSGDGPKYALQLMATTSYIGRRFRWLAPAGIADFDGDGRTEIAYVDRPHILHELVFVRLQNDRLVEFARIPNVTNHMIGDDFIAGGLRDCGLGPELVLASADWTRMIGIRNMQVADLGPMPPDRLKVMPAC